MSWYKTLKILYCVFLFKQTLLVVIDCDWFILLDAKQARQNNASVIQTHFKKNNFGYIYPQKISPAQSDLRYMS